MCKVHLKKERCDKFPKNPIFVLSKHCIFRILMCVPTSKPPSEHLQHAQRHTKSRFPHRLSSFFSNTKIYLQFHTIPYLDDTSFLPFILFFLASIVLLRFHHDKRIFQSDSRTRYITTMVHGDDI